MLTVGSHWLANIQEKSIPEPALYRLVQDEDGQVVHMLAPDLDHLCQVATSRVTVMKSSPWRPCRVSRWLTMRSSATTPPSRSHPTPMIDSFSRCGKRVSCCKDSLRKVHDGLQSTFGETGQSAPTQMILCSPSKFVDAPSKSYRRGRVPPWARSTCTSMSPMPCQATDWFG